MKPLNRNMPDTGKNNSGRPLSSDKIEIKVLFSSDNPVLLGKTFQSQTVYVSRNRLSLEVCRKIQLNSVLDMAITLKEAGRRYHLTGNVRDCSPTRQPDQYHLDIVLRERADIPTDFGAWNSQFTRNFLYSA